MKKLILATKNAGKAREFKQLFSGYGIETISLLELEQELPDVEETGDTFEDNALLKAETIAKQLNVPVLADDSGLEVDALEKRPGIYSARYAGLEKNDQKNYEKVLKELDNVEKEKRTARFVSVIALARPGFESVVKRGTCEGSIGYEPKGENGFGYDPVFYPNSFQQTMAQLTAEQKNAISHRRNALDKLEAWLKLELEAGRL